MGHSIFLEFKELATDSGGDGYQQLPANGILTMIDIETDESSSFDITISRVLPTGTLAPIYADTGISAALTSIGREDFNQQSTQLAGDVRVTLENAGEHDSAVKVHLTIIE